MPLVPLRDPLWGPTRLVVVGAALAVLLAAAPTEARPGRRSHSRTVKPVKKRTIDPAKRGAVARVSYGRELRPMRTVGRSKELLTLEEETAADIQKILRSPVLRNGLTGIFVADAKTGEPLFAVNADDPLNPASNVKLISTATALELLGPDFRYPTRVLGQPPAHGIVKGDVYLLGSYDPTLELEDFDELAGSLAARGIHQIDGNIVVGASPTRDGIYRAIIPVEIVAGPPGESPQAHLPAGFDLVEIRMNARTARRSRRSRLRYKTEITTTPAGQPRIVLTIGGTIGRDRRVEYSLWTRQRTATAVYSLIAALREHHIGITGEMKIGELGDFIGEAVTGGVLPVELARHESRALAEIVQRVNKWSVNWLADRVVMTAAALARRDVPSMKLALDEMYRWLERHTKLTREQVVIDTGSGLSYKTEISPRAIVSVIRSAAGFDEPEDATARAWRNSLAVAGRDGTLRRRFRGTDLGGRVVGKTGTLSTVIALSGILDVDPQRPLAFSLVTNTDAPLAKRLVRRAHEQVVRELSEYLEQTAPRVVAPQVTAPDGDLDLPDEPEETGPEAELDRETLESE